jgi:hypothetical protein
MPYFKLSVDTPEDLDNIKKELEKIDRCISTAKKKSGERSVFRV